MIPSFRFSPAQFLHDAKATADAIGAEYSESMTRRILNLYFRTSRKITWNQSERLVRLAAGKRPGPSLFSDMERFTQPDGYTFSVTMAVDTGEIERVGFYALRLPAGQFPAIGERLATFIQSAPSRDEEEMNAIAWSFGPDGDDYIKAERSYCGRLVALMKTWNSPITDAS